MIPTELIRFAYFPSWYEQLDALAQMALPEPWRYRSCPVERRNTRKPVLEAGVELMHRTVRGSPVKAVGKRNASGVSTRWHSGV